MAVEGREKYTHARAKFRGDATRRERREFRARACVCISPAPQTPSPKLDTTHSLPKKKKKQKAVLKIHLAKSNPLGQTDLASFKIVEYNCSTMLNEGRQTISTLLFTPEHKNRMAKRVYKLNSTMLNGKVEPVCLRP